MNNENTHNKEIGLRIRTARKAKGISQTDLAKQLDKSLRTIQKYESGEIEVSIATLNDISRILGCESTYLIGYAPEKTTLSKLSDIFKFMFELDSLQKIGFNIEVQRPPIHDGWKCSISFNGKDFSEELNQDICLFLEQYKEIREQFKSGDISQEQFQRWKDTTLAYYAGLTLEEKEESKS